MTQDQIIKSHAKEIAALRAGIHCAMSKFSLGDAYLELKATQWAADTIRDERKSSAPKDSTKESERIQNED